MSYRSHRRGGRGRGQSNYRQSNVTREIPIPSGTEGMIIGKGGSQIKELQRLPGIDYVRLDDGKLKIGGSSTDSVDTVEFRVRDILGKRSSYSGLFIKQLHFDMDNPIDHIKFVRMQGMSDLVSFQSHSLKAEPDGFYVLTSAPQHLETQFGNLSMGSTGSFKYKDSRNVTRLVKNVDVIVEGFKTVLSGSDFREFKNVNTELRFTGVVFHHINPELRRNEMPIHRIFEDSKDYRSQFSVSLNIPSARIKVELEKQGFEAVDSDAVTIVHLINPSKSSDDSYRAVFIENVPDSENEGSIDRRLTKEKKEELERIAGCSRPEDILQVPRKATGPEIRKAYKKKSLLVHPDKNGFPGATEAAKYIGNAKDDLLVYTTHGYKPHGYKPHEYKPALFPVGAQHDALPKLIALEGGKISHLLIDTVLPNKGLGCRIAMTTKDPVDNPRVVNFLEQAWEQGEIVTGGKLSIDSIYSVEAVRIKNTQLFTDGEYELKLEMVKQKAVQSFAKFHEFPELVMSCPALTDSIKVLQSNPDNSAQLDTVLHIFRDFVEKAEELAQVISSVDDRIVR